MASPAHLEFHSSRRRGNRTLGQDLFDGVIVLLSIVVVRVGLMASLPHGLMARDVYRGRWARCDCNLGGRVVSSGSVVWITTKSVVRSWGALVAPGWQPWHILASGLPTWWGGR